MSMSLNSIMTCDNGETGTGNTSEAHEFTLSFFWGFLLLLLHPSQNTSGFIGVRVVHQSLVFYVVFCMLLYLHFPLVIALSVFRFIASDCFFFSYEW